MTCFASMIITLQYCTNIIKYMLYNYIVFFFILAFYIAMGIFLLEDFKPACHLQLFKSWESIFGHPADLFSTHAWWKLAHCISIYWDLETVEAIWVQ